MPTIVFVQAGDWCGWLHPTAMAERTDATQASRWRGVLLCPHQERVVVLLPRVGQWVTPFTFSWPAYPRSTHNVIPRSATPRIRNSDSPRETGVMSSKEATPFSDRPVTSLGRCADRV